MFNLVEDKEKSLSIESDEDDSMVYCQDYNDFDDFEIELTNRLKIIDFEQKVTKPAEKMKIFHHQLALMIPIIVIMFVLNRFFIIQNIPTDIANIVFNAIWALALLVIIFNLITNYSHSEIIGIISILVGLLSYVSILHIFAFMGTVIAIMSLYLFTLILAIYSKRRIQRLVVAMPKKLAKRFENIILLELIDNLEGIWEDVNIDYDQDRLSLSIKFPYRRYKVSIINEARLHRHIYTIILTGRKNTEVEMKIKERIHVALSNLIKECSHRKRNH